MEHLKLRETYCNLKENSEKPFYTAEIYWSYIDLLVLIFYTEMGLQ